MPDESTELKDMAFIAAFVVVALFLVAIVLGIIFGWLPAWPTL